jgi:hypothetical protein
MIQENTCAICFHKKQNHSFFNSDTGQQISCCLEFRCRCTGYEPLDDTIPQYLRDIDRYMAQFDHIKYKMQWVLIHIKYFRNFTDKYLPFAWWYYINHYNPWHQTLTKEIYQKLDSADSITRARRLWYQWDREHGTNNYLPFKMTVSEQKAYKQMAIEEYIVSKL